MGLFYGFRPVYACARPGHPGPPRAGQPGTGWAEWGDECFGTAVWVGAGGYYAGWVRGGLLCADAGLRGAGHRARGGRGGSVHSGARLRGGTGHSSAGRAGPPGGGGRRVAGDAGACPGRRDGARADPGSGPRAAVRRGAAGLAPDQRGRRDQEQLPGRLPAARRRRRVRDRPAAQPGVVRRRERQRGDPGRGDLPAARRVPAGSGPGLGDRRVRGRRPVLDADVHHQAAG